MKPTRILLTTAALIAWNSTIGFGQNTTFAGAVHIVAGQPPMRVMLASGSPDRYYDAEVVAGRSYCAEATPSDTEANSADPAVTVFRADQSTTLGVETSASQEPKGQAASRICFIAPATETIFIKLSPENALFENREYSMRFVETTLWANWFFVGGSYSSFTILRNTTNSPLFVTIVWRAENGSAVVSLPNQLIAANGTFYRDARQVMGCGFPAVCMTTAGSVEVAHAGSPEAIVGSQTTLSGQTGLSFDTIMFQRRPW